EPGTGEREIADDVALDPVVEQCPGEEGVAPAAAVRECDHLGRHLHARMRCGAVRFDIVRRPTVKLLLDAPAGPLQPLEGGAYVAPRIARAERPQQQYPGGIRTLREPDEEFERRRIAPVQVLEQD